MNLQDYYKPIEPKLYEVRQKIEQQFRISDQNLSEVFRLVSTRHGKMLRSALVLLSGQLVSEVRSEHIDLAAMVELVHQASLLHDDVIDKAELRRGQPSANAQWGNTTAVLLGDFLLSRAFILGASSELDGTMRILCQTAQTLCIGELKQNLFKGSWALTEQDYFQIIEAKTASLFQCSCQLGAMASGASGQQEAALSEFGLQYGVAFQIADDLRDILCSEKQEGKTLGTDLLEKKLTLPMIHWINRDPERKQALIERMTSCTDVKELTQQMYLDGSIDYAKQAAQACIDKAVEQLQMFSPGLPKQTLTALVEDVFSGISW